MDTSSTAMINQPISRDATAALGARIWCGLRQLFVPPTFRYSQRLEAKRPGHTSRVFNRDRLALRSVFLRAVGLAALLAVAGPVHAQSCAYAYINNYNIGVH